MTMLLNSHTKERKPHGDSVIQKGAGGVSRPRAGKMENPGPETPPDPVVLAHLETLETLSSPGTSPNLIDISI